jgi:hypothetical protein
LHTAVHVLVTHVYDQVSVYVRELDGTSVPYVCCPRMHLYVRNMSLWVLRNLRCNPAMLHLLFLIQHRHVAPHTHTSRLEHTTSTGPNISKVGEEVKGRPPACGTRGSGCRWLLGRKQASLDGVGLHKFHACLWCVYLPERTTK